MNPGTGSSAGSPLPQQAMRRLVEAIDACRGQPQVFVVFRNSFPYEAVSVQTTEAAAQGVVNAESGLSYFGPVTPRAAPSSFTPLRKKLGTSFEPLPESVTTVALLDADGQEVERYRVDRAGGLPNFQTDIEALLLNASSIDRYAIPYLTRVFGAPYAAARRAEWIRD